MTTVPTPGSTPAAPCALGLRDSGDSSGGPQQRFCLCPAVPCSAVTLCTLGVGSTFGESILNPLPRDTTVLTRTTCELLRVERRDFKAIWE
ncbi:hypothetical protein FOCC_FOCC017633, partial [Frankliniella occidentalis]